MKKTLLATLATTALALAPLSGQALDAAAWLSFLPAADRQALLERGELTSVGTTLADLKSGASSPLAPELKQGLAVASPTVAMEGWFVFPRPAGDVRLGLYNAVNALSTMEGLQYFSATRQRMETLVLASYRVESPAKPVRIADPVFAEVPATQVAYVFQKDNKLGDGLSQVAWYARGDGSLVLTLRNLERLDFLFLPLVEPGNLQMLFVVKPLADRMVVYGALLGQTVSLFGLEKTKDESFRNRMRALASWLGARLATLR